MSHGYIWSSYFRGIGWDVLQPKGNIIAPTVFIPAKKKTPKMRGSFAMQAARMSMLKAICGIDDCFKFDIDSK